MVRATVLATGATAAGGAPSAAAPPLFTSALWFGAAGLATERGRGREEQQLIIVRVASRAATEVYHRVWAEVTVGSSTEFEFQIKQRYSGQYGGGPGHYLETADTAGRRPTIPSIFVVCFIVGPYVADLQVSTIVMPTLAVVMGAIGTGATLLLRGQRYRFARA